MNSLHRLILRARRRRLLDSALLHAARWTAWALLAAIVLLAIDRLFALALPWQAFAAIAAAGAFAGAVIAWTRRPLALDVAVDLDRALRLRDQLGSALAIETCVRPSDDPEFAALVKRDVDQLAARLDARGATPIRFTRHWLVAAIFAGALVAGFEFLPARRPASAELVAVLSPEQRARFEEHRSEIAQALQDVKDQLGEADGSAITDHLAQRDLQTLDRLAQQFALDTPDAAPAIEELQQLRDESAAALSELADRIDAEAEREAAAIEALTDRFAGLNDPSTPPPPMSAAEFTRALQRGDLGDAGDLLDHMTRSARDMDEQSRAELAKFLRDMSERIADADETADASLSERAEQMEQAMRDQGLDEPTIEQLLGESREPIDQGAEPAPSDTPETQPDDTQHEDVPPPSHAQTKPTDNAVADDASSEAGAAASADEPTSSAQEPAEPSTQQSQTQAAEQSSDAPSAQTTQENETTQATPDQPGEQATAPADASQTADSAAEALRQQGIDERIAEDMARDLQDLQREQAEQQQASRDAQRVSDAMRSAADQLENPPPAAPSQEPSQVGPSPQESPQAGDSEQHAVQPDAAPSELAEQHPADAAQPQQQQQPGAPAAQPDGAQQAPAQQQPNETQQQPAAVTAPDPAAMQRAMDELGTERVQKMAENLDPQTVSDLIDKIEPDLLKQLVDKIDPATLRNIAEQFQQNPPSQGPDQPQPPPSPPPIDEATLRKLAEKLDPETLRQLAEKFRDLQGPRSPENRTLKQAQAQPSETDEAPPDAQPPAAEPQPEAGRGESMEAQQADQTMPAQPQPGDALREIDARRRSAEQRRQAADRARQAARDIMESLTPEERSRWAEAWRRQEDQGQERASDQNASPGGPGGDPTGSETPEQSPAGAAPPAAPPGFEALDLAGEALADQIIATWLSDEPPPPGSPAGAPDAGAGRAQRVSTARRMAERAVNESAVPARYHELIRRYFDRLNRTVEQASRSEVPGPAAPSESPPPSPPADGDAK